MKKDFDLTDQEFRVIFNQAHKNWLDGQNVMRGADQTDKLLLCKSYFNATINYLRSRGYKITKNVENSSEG